ncbi:hypothetical protein T261_0692 [Streptomyces lydicus]|nr:hypothetical protein T261_0692 [Streptomyces lydicus]
MQPPGGTTEDGTARRLPAHPDLFRGHAEGGAGRGAQQRGAGRMPLGGAGQQDQDGAGVDPGQGARTDI